MSEKSNAGISWFVCEDGHVHMSFHDEQDNELFAIAIDIDDWFDLSDEVEEEIDIMMAEEEAQTAVIH